MSPASVTAISTFGTSPSSSFTEIVWLVDFSEMRWSCTMPLRRRVSVPSGFLPLAIRTSGGSMPWSMALRTRCVIGSLIASRTLRSSSVSRPSISSLTLRSSWRERSRTTRGSLDQTVSTGCIRVFITCSCSSLVTSERRCAERASELST